MLATRIASAVVLAALAGAALWGLPPIGWALFCMAVMIIGAWEWARLARCQGRARVAVTAAFASAYIIAGYWIGILSGADGTVDATRAGVAYALSAAFWLTVAPWWLARNPPSPSAGLVLACGVVVLVPAYIAVVHLRGFGIGVFLIVGAIVWIADIAAYFSGRAFGRHKLAPAISPGKTWEGVYGALLGVGAYSALLVGGFNQALGSQAPFLVIIMAALGLAAISVVGDLFESALKRQAGVKDSGRILPGHGGVLDRMDALIAVLPLAMLGTLCVAARTA